MWLLWLCVNVFSSVYSDKTNSVAQLIFVSSAVFQFSSYLTGEEKRKGEENKHKRLNSAVKLSNWNKRFIVEWLTCNFIIDCLLKKFVFKLSIVYRTIIYIYHGNARMYFSQCAVIVLHNFFLRTQTIFLISCVSFFCLPDWLTAKIE